MARVKKAQKQRAFRLQDRLLYGGAATAPAAGAAALIPGAGPFISIGILTLGAALGVAGVRVGKLGRDPARDDFEQETVVGPPLFDIELVRARLGDGPLTDLIQTEEEIARLADALLAAIERASGAELAQNIEAQLAREDEAYRLSLDLGLRLELASDQIDPVRAQLADFSGAPFEGGPLPTPLIALLSREQLTDLEVFGVPEASLATVISVVGEDPVGELSTHLGEIAEASGELGQAMREDAQRHDLLEPGQDDAAPKAEAEDDYPAPAEDEAQGEDDNEAQGEDETLA